MTTAELIRREGSRAGGVRPILQSEFAQAWDLAFTNPIANTFVLSRIESAMSEPWRLGGSLWGYFVGSELESMLFVGANIVPAQTTPRAREEFARELIYSGRRSSSILGPRDQVLDLWENISPAWGGAREVRKNQPLMIIDSAPQGFTAERFRKVRRVNPDELSILLPASIHMFTQEVGVSPVAHGGREQYERRVAEVIEQRYAFAVITEGEVQFKAEIGFISAGIAQLQGVWVAPHLRGQGFAAPAIAQVVEIIQDELVGTVSLYVNDFNKAAINAYRRVGFREVGSFATVLF